MVTEPALNMRHVPQLDGIRALAVLIVMVAHVGFGPNLPGGFGVTVFFFLSGYLITSLMRAEAETTGAVDLRAFYIRRVLRIMPPLYVTLVLLTVGSFLGISKPPLNPDAITWDYLFLSNYSHLWGEEGGLPIPLWSLAVEEHFYMLFPITFVLFLGKRSPPEAARLCMIGCIVALILRFLTMFVDPEQLARNYYWTHTRVDSILFGCCLALWNNPVLDRGAWRASHWHAVAAGMAIMVTFVWKDPVFRETVRYSIQGVALFVLFSYVLSSRSKLVTRILTSPPMVWIGLVSYSLYLCHFAIFEALREWQLRPIEIFGAGMLLSCGYAFLMRRWVELPVIQWRRRNPMIVKSIVPIAR